MTKKYCVSAEAELEMLPCPFCGGTDTETDFSGEGVFKGCWFVRCTSCKTTGPVRHNYIHPGDGVILWNTRVTEARIKDEKSSR